MRGPRSAGGKGGGGGGLSGTPRIIPLPCLVPWRPQAQADRGGYDKPPCTRALCLLPAALTRPRPVSHRAGRGPLCAARGTPSASPCEKGLFITIEKGLRGGAPRHAVDRPPLRRAGRSLGRSLLPFCHGAKQSCAYWHPVLLGHGKVERLPTLLAVDKPMHVTLRAKTSLRYSGYPVHPPHSPCTNIASFVIVHNPLEGNCTLYFLENSSHLESRNTCTGRKFMSTLRIIVGSHHTFFVSGTFSRNS